MFDRVLCDAVAGAARRLATAIARVERTGNRRAGTNSPSFGAAKVNSDGDDSWVQDWVQVAAVSRSLLLVSCAGSTKALTATNQEVAGSSPAGRTSFLRKIDRVPARRRRL